MCSPLAKTLGGFRATELRFREISNDKKQSKLR